MISRHRDNTAHRKLVQIGMHVKSAAGFVATFRPVSGPKSYRESHRCPWVKLWVHQIASSLRSSQRRVGVWNGERLDRRSLRSVWPDRSAFLLAVPKSTVVASPDFTPARFRMERVGVKGKEPEIRCRPFRRRRADRGPSNGRVLEYVCQGDVQADPGLIVQAGGHRISYAALVGAFQSPQKAVQSGSG